MEATLTKLVCLVDEFCKETIPAFEQHLLTQGLKKRRHASQLSPSEIMTLCIHFHQSQYRTFKHYYIRYVQKYLAHLFPGLVSYPRFVVLMKSVAIPISLFLQSLKGEQTGIYFIDSTTLYVCHIKREKQHKVFKNLTKKSKSTMGWFLGFKLHLVINDKGELIAFKITAGNVDDRKPVPDLVSHLIGKLYSDKGYISKKLTQGLAEQNLPLITRVKKNMKNKLMPVFDKLRLRKRAIIETVNDQLKNISQIEHTRHRSIFNFAINILGPFVLTLYNLKSLLFNLTLTL